MQRRALTARTLKYVLKNRARNRFGEALPRTFCFMERLKNKTRSRTVTPETDLVLEGYPRCGNSFTFRVLDTRTQSVLNIAHHIHLPVQIELGIRLRRPVLVLIRPPEDAVVSFVGLQLQAGIRQQGCELSDAELIWRLREAVRYYVRFYERVQSIDGGYVLATFDTITRDLAAVFSALNRRFGLCIPTYPVADDERDRIFASAIYHLAPNAERDGHKARIRQLCSEIFEQPWGQRARAVYAACSVSPQAVVTGNTGVY